jgi:hypothetical protein
MSVTRISFQAAMRAAAVELLTDYAASAGVKLQIYRARPRSLMAPVAFVDKITETLEYPGNVTWRQRMPRVEVIVIHGLFDSGDAADAKDAFVDDFIDWVTDNVHAADPNTTIGLVATEDIPDYVNDWMPPAEQRTWYATRLTLEGFAGG